MPRRRHNEPDNAYSKDAILQVRIDPEAKDLLAATVAHLGISQSSYVRIAVLEKLEDDAWIRRLREEIAARTSN